MSTAAAASHLIRTTKKSEMMRPLKPASMLASKLRNEGKLNTVEGIMMLTEHISALLASDDNFGESLQANITSLCQHLKSYGCHLEVLYKEQLDRAFITFRNACQDERLDYISRVHLLQLIELRANQWCGTDHMSHYYATHATDSTVIVQQEPTITQIMPESTGGTPVTILAPGEVLRPSGKFPKPTRIPGKNYCKDEVVIRNADSGKVMGIKGRRVHMIEELSETIISFQRVAPGAKERLVQITGSSEETINHAKQLMEETIRRNASPVRDSTSAVGHDSGSSLSSASGPTDAESFGAQGAAPVLAHSLSAGDATLGEYKYTVTVGTRSLKITGPDLDLIRTAKLVLDEYFNGESERFVSAFNPAAWDVVQVNSNVEPQLEPDVADSKQTTSSTKSATTYDAIVLVKASQNVSSSVTPPQWDHICKEFPSIIRKVREPFDVEAYLQAAASTEVNIVISATEMTSSSPELE